MRSDECFHFSFGRKLLFRKVFLLKSESGKWGVIILTEKYRIFDELRRKNNRKIRENFFLIFDFLCKTFF